MQIENKFAKDKDIRVEDAQEFFKSTLQKILEKERLINIKQVNNQSSNNLQSSFIDENRKIQEEILRIAKQHEERSVQEEERRIQQEERRRQDDALKNRGCGTINRTPKQDFDDKFYGTGRWSRK